MKKRECVFYTFLFFILIFPSVLSIDNYNNYNSLDIHVNITNEIESFSKNLIVNLTTFPRKEQNQEVFLITSPESEINNNIIFNLKKGNLTINVKSLVKRKFFISKLKNEYKWPFEVPEEYSRYTKPSEYIDSDNKEIRKKALELYDEKGILHTLYNLAEYVHDNTIYDLNYSYVTKKASWVLKNKKGVCSEFTNLFIALCRSLGIPARYVSGTAYSNLGNNFGEHAWAEVYIPELNKWVPYDVTFQQYMFLDSTHIILKRMLDPSEPSVEYYYTGKININELNIDAEIIGYGKKIQPLTDFSLNLYKNKVSLDSYVPLEVKIKNLQPYFLSIPIFIEKAPDILKATSKTVFLSPYEEKKIYFILHTPNLEKCTEGCKSEIIVKTFFGKSKTKEIFFSSYYPKISLEESKLIAKEIEGKIEKKSILFCNLSKYNFYRGDKINITCIVKALKKIDGKLCFENKCEKIYIKKGSEIKKNFFTLAEKPLYCINLIENGNLISNSCLNIKIKNKPFIKIISVENTEGDYGEIIKTKLIVLSNKNLKVEIKIGNRKFYTDLKEGKNILEIPIKTWEIKDKVELVFRYKYDGREYETKYNLNFHIKDVSFFKKILIWLKILLNFDF